MSSNRPTFNLTPKKGGNKIHPTTLRDNDRNRGPNTPYSGIKSSFSIFPNFVHDDIIVGSNDPMAQNQNKTQQQQGPSQSIMHTNINQQQQQQKTSNINQNVGGDRGRNSIFEKRKIDTLENSDFQATNKIQKQNTCVVDDDDDDDDDEQFWNVVANRVDKITTPKHTSLQHPSTNTQPTNTQSPQYDSDDDSQFEPIFVQKSTWKPTVTGGGSGVSTNIVIKKNPNTSTPLWTNNRTGFNNHTFRNNTFSTNNNNNNTTQKLPTSDLNVKCNCGRNANRYQIKKVTNENCGKYFYSCGFSMHEKNQGMGCKFFRLEQDIIKERECYPILKANVSFTSSSNVKDKTLIEWRNIHIFCRCEMPCTLTETRISKQMSSEEYFDAIESNGGYNNKTDIRNDEDTKTVLIWRCPYYLSSPTSNTSLENSDIGDDSGGSSNNVGKLQSHNDLNTNNDGVVVDCGFKQLYTGMDNDSGGGVMQQNAKNPSVISRFSNRNVLGNNKDQAALIDGTLEDFQKQPVYCFCNKLAKRMEMMIQSSGELNQSKNTAAFGNFNTTTTTQLADKEFYYTCPLDISDDARCTFFFTEKNLMAARKNDYNVRPPIQKAIVHNHTAMRSITPKSEDENRWSKKLQTCASQYGYKFQESTIYESIYLHRTLKLFRGDYDEEEHWTLLRGCFKTMARLDEEKLYYEHAKRLAQHDNNDNDDDDDDTIAMKIDNLKKTTTPTTAIDHSWITTCGIIQLHGLCYDQKGWLISGDMDRVIFCDEYNHLFLAMDRKRLWRYVVENTDNNQIVDYRDSLRAIDYDKTQDFTVRGQVSCSSASEFERFTYIRFSKSHLTRLRQLDILCWIWPMDSKSITIQDAERRALLDIPLPVLKLKKPHSSPTFTSDKKPNNVSSVDKTSSSKMDTFSKNNDDFIDEDDPSIFKENRVEECNGDEECSGILDLTQRSRTKTKHVKRNRNNMQSFPSNTKYSPIVGSNIDSVNTH